MTWSDLYILCFIVGFLFSLSVLFVFGGRVHIHLPSRCICHFTGRTRWSRTSHGGLRGGTHISWFTRLVDNGLPGLVGGTGYLLTRHSHLLAEFSLMLATVAGLAAGFVVFRFMVKLVGSTDAPMKSEDYRIEGSLGTSACRSGRSGTGEIIFSWRECGRCAGARSDDGKSIEKGAEVVIERYEKGIAYVKRWEDSRTKVFPDWR